MPRSAPDLSLVGGVGGGYAAKCLGGLWIVDVSLEAADSCKIAPVASLDSMIPVMADM